MPPSCELDLLLRINVAEGEKKSSIKHSQSIFFLQIRCQAAKTYISNQSKPPYSVVRPIGDIIQPETRQAVYLIAPDLRFLLHSTILKGVMYLTGAEQENGFNDTDLIVFSALVQYVESIHRIKEAMEQRWKQSIRSILIKM